MTNGASVTAVLITIQNGAVDYVASDKNTQVVIVDFDSFDPDTTFPDDIAAVLTQVVSLPPGMPWKRGVITRLNEVKKACKKSLWAGPLYEE